MTEEDEPITLASMLEGDGLSDDENSTQEDSEESIPVHYRSVFEFFHGMIAPLLQDRLIGRHGLRWSKKWYDCQEAMLRMDAMWRSYEMLKEDPGAGLSKWILEHYDPHMRVLTADDGPFGECRDESPRGDYPPHEPTK